MRAEVVGAVRAHGLSHAFTMESGAASANDDPLLPRIAPTDRPGVMVGLTLTRQLAAAVVTDTWRGWWARFVGASVPPLVLIATRDEPAPPPAADSAFGGRVAVVAGAR